jgi:hypothetical protein
MSAESIVQTVGPCTEDQKDCEIVRAAIILKDVEADNQHIQDIRKELAKAACRDCACTFLADIN